MLQKKTLLFRIFFYFVSIAIAGCAVPTIEPCFKDGIDYSKIPYYIIRKDWDSCYLRGCSYMDGECFDLAIQEFKKAIMIRPNDKRVTRPYGMHFLEYFPHREMGISYYNLGYLDKAMRELERSLADNPSSKAKYYLNKTRKKYLHRNNLDDAPPTLCLTSPTAPFYLTNKSSLEIKGQAGDDHFVSGISINNKPIFIELSAKNIPFSETLFLKRGRNHILITAKDLVDKTIEKKVEITVDKMGPIINLSCPLEKYMAYTRHILIEGIIVDDSGINEFSINEQLILTMKKEKLVEFSEWIDVPIDVQQLRFQAKDRAGNETKGHIELSALNTSRRMLTSHYKQKQINNKMIRIAMRGASMLAFSHNARNQTSDEEDPILSIDPLPKMTTHDEIPLYCKINYRNWITSIKIFLNNRLITGKTYDDPDLLDRMKRMLTSKRDKVSFWGDTIELDPGQNEIVIEITNEIGLSKRVTYQVTKKEEEIFDEKYRLCIFTPPVEDISKAQWICPTTERYLSLKLNAAFVNQKRFNVVEREKLEQILKELKLSISDLSNDKKAVRVGKMVIADALIKSAFKQDKKGIEFIGSMVDIESTVYLCEEDSYLEFDGNKDEVKAKVAEIVAMKIRDKFPLCRGKVLEKKGKKIRVNIGQNKNINPRTKLIVYREDDWDTTVLSEAQVEKVFNDYCRATLLTKSNIPGINVEDLVITK